VKAVLLAIWEGWKKFAKAWGKVVNTLLLSIVYFTLFGLMGLITKVTGQDLLDARPRPEDESVWHDWERHELTFEDSLRQS
jgi:hypothetical protein